MTSPNVHTTKKPPIEFIVVEDGMWENRSNLIEAKKVVETIKKVLRTRKENETIGVITFNAQQRNLIEDLLDQEILTRHRLSQKIQKELTRKDNDQDTSLFIKNIENVQGDERDVIIFSTAYAKNKEGKFLRQFGWLNNDGGQNRLNVAISRAKKKIYFITSFYPETFRVEDLKGQGPKLLKKYMEYAYAISTKDYPAASKILASLNEHPTEHQEIVMDHLLESVYARLKQLEYDVERSIGIGGYVMDFVLVDPKTKNRVLGILCTDQHPKNDDVRNHYYHQEKYLKVRGWELYRIFGVNWYKDPNKEMREIRKCLKNTTNK